MFSIILCGCVSLQFDDAVGTEVKDVIDRWRRERAHAIAQEGMDPDKASALKKVDFEGHGVLIVARDTVSDDVPLCLSIGATGNKVELLPCFAKWVPATLSPNWESGAVVLRETVHHTRWEVGPCTSDGQVARLYVNECSLFLACRVPSRCETSHTTSSYNIDRDNGDMNVTLGSYSATGPRCLLQQMDGMRAGRCFDGGSTSLQPGGPTQVYPCMREWFQFLSFGDGRIAPKGSLYSTIPSHIVKQLRNLGHEQIPYMCLGVYERGTEDELDWTDENYLADKEERVARRADSTSAVEKDWEALSGWKDATIMTTQCTNAGAVIEWVFVPFIADEENNPENEGTTADPPNSTNAEAPQGDNREL
jgi:hypothetical protein